MIGRDAEVDEPFRLRAVAEAVGHGEIDDLVGGLSRRALDHEVRLAEGAALGEVAQQQIHECLCQRGTAEKPDVFTVLLLDFGKHGVIEPGARYSGELEKGLVVINNIARRGRRLGFDIFQEARAQVPLDLVGMGAEEAGGLGEVRHAELPAFAARYRFLFNPIRYTSLGLAVIEAMMAGMPVVALATTEMVTVIRDGRNGFIDTSLERLVERMKFLLAHRDAATSLGRAARLAALERFNIARFVADWNAAFLEVTGSKHERFVA